MMKIAPSALSNEALITETRAIMVRSNSLSADLIAHLAEIDIRKLYLEQAYPSLFAWCVAQLGCSEDVTCNLIAVARASRKWPAVLGALREGRVHLTGLRMLAPHFNDEGHEELLDAASGKSKREIEELVAQLAPKPPVPSSIRKLPSRKDRPGPVQSMFVVQSLTGEFTTQMAQDSLQMNSDQIHSGQMVSDPMTEPPGSMFERSWPEVKDKPNGTKGDPSRRSKVEPLSEESYKVTFTASRSLKDKIQEAQDLLKHRNPDGDLSELVERGLDLLIAEVRKKRFAVSGKRKGGKRHPEPSAGQDDPCQSVVVKKPDHRATDNEAPSNRNRKPRSRHIPAEVRRAVVRRDGERCSYVDDSGNRCPERGGLEFDHIEGFARTPEHSVQGIRLMCRAHNQWAAENMYGRSFMKEKRLGQIDNRKKRKEKSCREYHQ